MDMQVRIKKGLWPHKPLKINECVEVISEYLQSNKCFPVSWVEKKNGMLIGDLLVIEKISEKEFVCHYRYSHPTDLLKISEEGKKRFKTAQAAIKYYLRHELYLPGDLDGWKVEE
ncbi:MAG: hypothetical protein WC330_06125 [Candidatus Omnitrophota bacterium]